MIVLKWVFPVSLAVLAIVHLVSCWRGDDDLRKPTKVALMPVVALSYLAFARQPSIWVVAGLLFGCLAICFCSGRSRRSSLRSARRRSSWATCAT